MRWLLVSSQHHSSHGGIGTYVSRFVEAATQAGWSVDLVTRPGNQHPPRARVHVVETPDLGPEFADRTPGLRRMERIRPYRYALWSCAVADRLLQLPSGFDAVEFVDCQAEGFASLGSARIRRHFHGVPLLVHAHTPMFVEEEINGCDPARFGRSIYHDWERRALGMADGVIVTSRLLGDRMPAHVPRVVIPYPIIESMKPIRSERKGPTILLVGSIQPRKGVDVWVRSLNKVMSARPDVNAVMIGPDTLTGPNESSMFRHLNTLIDARFVDRLHWLGACEHKRVLSLIAAASLVVVPSVFESFSFAAAEALGCGTPVLVSDQVGVAEHVPDLPTCPAEDVRLWAEAQLLMLSDQSRSIECAQRHRARLLEICSPFHHLRLREEFTRAIQAALPEHRSRSDAPDAFEEIRLFVRSVEDAERSDTVVSSV